MLNSSKDTRGILALAPMMGYSNPDMEKIMSVVAPSFDFYSQMYHTNAIINNPKLLENTYSSNAIIQLGGNQPEGFKKAASILSQIGFSKININVGCPSPRVTSGSFGACLMLNPNIVKDCIQAISEFIPIDSISVKCRIGVDNFDTECFLDKFINVCKSSGMKNFIIHARIAKLKGLNPKQNREIPPLNYDRVYQLKSKYKDINCIINGGIKTINDITNHLKHVNGVMIGRLCYENIYQLHLIDSHFNLLTACSREELTDLIRSKKFKLNHLSSLYKGCKGAKQWRSNLHQENYQ